MGYGPLLILTPKIVKEQWVKSDPLNGKTARRFQNNNNNNNNKLLKSNLLMDAQASLLIQSCLRAVLMMQ